MESDVQKFAKLAGRVELLTLLQFASESLQRNKWLSSSIRGFVADSEHEAIWIHSYNGGLVWYIVSGKIVRLCSLKLWIYQTHHNCWKTARNLWNSIGPFPRSGNSPIINSYLSTKPRDPEKLFKMDVFYPMIDTIENLLVTRFRQLSKYLVFYTTSK